MVTAYNVADLFLKLSEPEVGDYISNLKLQKLVYYAQGFHLAIYNEPLFNEDIVAWEHGPVVPELYRVFKGHGSDVIPVPEDVDFSMFSEEQIDLVKEISEVYGQFSAWKLRNMTHSETPWLSTDRNEVIDLDVMKEFFRTLVNE